MAGDGSAQKGSAFVVVGGGIAGVCCAEELCRICPNCSVTLISASFQLKVGLCGRPNGCLAIPLSITLNGISPACNDMRIMHNQIPSMASTYAPRMQGVETVSHVTQNVEELKGL